MKVLQLAALFGGIVSAVNPLAVRNGESSVLFVSFSLCLRSTSSYLLQHFEASEPTFLTLFRRST
jgi:hypothetical protein